jgi:hypothetical protein
VAGYRKPIPDIVRRETSIDACEFHAESTPENRERRELAEPAGQWEGDHDSTRAPGAKAAAWWSSTHDETYSHHAQLPADAHICSRLRSRKAATRPEQVGSSARSHNVHVMARGTNAGARRSDVTEVDCSDIASVEPVDARFLNDTAQQQAGARWATRPENTTCPRGLLERLVRPEPQYAHPRAFLFQSMDRTARRTNSPNGSRKLSPNQQTISHEYIFIVLPGSTHSGLWDSNQAMNV